MTQSDPTDNALATIASILDPPENRRESEKAAVGEQRHTPPPIPAAPPPIEAHGYSKFGPGPMAAMCTGPSARASRPAGASPRSKNAATPLTDVKITHA